jgi:hypothetical protein
MTLNLLEERLINPSKKEAVNILLIYEFVFCLCASEDFIAHRPLEVFGYKTGTALTVLQESSNKTCSFWLRQGEGKWVGNDLHNFTVVPYPSSLTIRKD